MPAPSWGHGEQQSRKANWSSRLRISGFWFPFLLPAVSMETGVGPGKIRLGFAAEAQCQPGCLCTLPASPPHQGNARVPPTAQLWGLSTPGIFQHPPSFHLVTPGSPAHTGQCGNWDHHAAPWFAGEGGELGWHPLDPQPFPAAPLSPLVLQTWHSSAFMGTSQQCSCGRDPPAAPRRQGTLALSPLLTPHLRVFYKDPASAATSPSPSPAQDPQLLQGRWGVGGGKRTRTRHLGGAVKTNEWRLLKSTLTEKCYSRN